MKKYLRALGLGMMAFLLTAFSSPVDGTAVTKDVVATAPTISQLAANAQIRQEQTDDQTPVSQKTANLVTTKDGRMEGKLVRKEDQTAEHLEVKKNPELTCFKINDSEWKATDNSEEQTKRIDFFPYSLAVSLLSDHQAEGEWKSEGKKVTMTYEGTNDTLLDTLNTHIEEAYEGGAHQVLNFTIDKKSGTITDLSWKSEGISQETEEAMTTEVQASYTGFNTLQIPDHFGQVTSQDREGKTP